MRLLACCVALATLAGCGEDASHPVSVVLTTDWMAGTEFDSVRLELAPAADSFDRTRFDGTIDPAGDYLTGVQIAETTAAAGTWHLRTTLLTAGGAEVAERDTIFELRGATTVTVVITRDCPPARACPDGQACVGGECVDARCGGPDDPGDACGAIGCGADTDCAPAAASCAAPSCRGGVCLYAGAPGACAAGEACDPDDGCVPVETPPLDAGAPPTDAGPGPDAGPGLDAGPADGGVDAGPRIEQDCLAYLEMGLSTGDGTYRIDPDGPGGEPPFDAYCDMTTDGGGWTLVYAYTFTEYGTFTSSANAVTPIPNWPQNPALSYVSVSTTPPTGPTDYAALDFARWAELGRDFLVLSNITDDVSCEEAGGSLVDNTGGAITCVKIDNRTGLCPTVVPTTYRPAMTSNRGAALNMGAYYQYWDGTTDGNWPTHDPCGTNRANHLTGVADPRGAIYLRR